MINILTHKHILENKMKWVDIVQHHLPHTTEEERENIFNWCYNRAASRSRTCNPKNSLILSIFQNEYLKLE